MSTMHRQAHAGSALPQFTNRWLKVNTIETGATFAETSPFGGEAGRDVLDERLFERPGFEGLGISDELLAHNRSNANFTMSWSLHQGDAKRVDLELNADHPYLVDRHHLVTAPGHCASALIRVFGEDGVDAERNGAIYIDVAEDAIVRLLLVNETGRGSVSNLSVIADVAAGGTLHITEVELGAGTVNFNYGCNLNGYESKTTVSTAYLADGETKLDMFYNIRHIGELAESDIQSNGALFDCAHKQFRGTLDFLKGSSGSKGNEEEFAILMSETAHSVAVPLLLCHEDDVEGNHAASAGRLDEDILFYLMSRGLGRREAEGLIIEARMMPTLDRIADEALRNDLRNRIHERIVRR